MNVIERFMSKVDADPEGCWVWTAGSTHAGHGRFWHGGRHHIASRWSYEHFVGPVPDDMQVDHVCHQPACVRPTHLRPLSPQDNSRYRRVRSDSASGVRGAKYDKRSGRYAASVNDGTRRLHLGMFSTPEEAGEVARRKRIELFGAHLEPSTDCHKFHTGGNA